MANYAVIHNVHGYAIISLYSVSSPNINLSVCSKSSVYIPCECPDFITLIALVA